MRQFHNIVVLLLCLAAIRAENEQQQKQQRPPTQEKPQQQAWDTTPKLGPPTPLDIPPKDLQEAREELRKILSELPIQTIEPLVETPQGYCRAFTALCTIACEERLVASGTTSAGEAGDIDAMSSEITSAECANPDAKTVFHAEAKCECAGLDLTDRVNFALVGGITASDSSPTTDFTADGLLDGLTFLPGVSTVINIIHIAQNVCSFVDSLKFLTDGSASTPLTPTPTPTAGAGGSGGSFWDTVKGWFPGLFGNGGSGVKPTPTSPTPLPGPSSPPTPISDSNKPTGTVSAASPTPTPKKWFFGLFSETDEQGNVLEEGAKAGPDSKRKEEAGESDDARRLVSHDGRVARIVRARKRLSHRKKDVQKQGKHDL